jgi:2-keto-4-pentenoate hydratase/2-oxohepta-3-ene-1,7-dioic acid hydratase in catechol pathway
MKIVRMIIDRRICWGVLDGAEVMEIEGSIYRKFRIADRRHEQKIVRLLPPCRPSKVIAVGRNYIDHAQEKRVDLPEEPRIFLKSPSSIIGPGDIIKLPYPNHIVEHEAELAFIIKKQAKNIKVKDALNYILGYTCSNDVSDRTIQSKEGVPSRAKSFDTFTPIGPCIETDLDPGNLLIECRVNGQLRQSANTKQMIFNVPVILNFISEIMTLLPGDIIMTGTPGGTSLIYAGDRVEVSIANIGTLCNSVEASKHSPSASLAYANSL